MDRLKKLFIPSGDKKAITELRSWTVTWRVLTGWSMATKRYDKVFVKNDEAKEFKKQLEESAKLTKAYITTSIKEN